MRKKRKKPAPKSTVTHNQILGALNFYVPE